MDSITRQREVLHSAMIKHGLHTYNRTTEIDNLIGISCELLDWAEKARTLLAAHKVQFNELRIPCFDHGDDCGCDFCDENLAMHGIVSKLLEELPE